MYSEDLPSLSDLTVFWDDSDSDDSDDFFTSRRYQNLYFYDYDSDDFEDTKVKIEHYHRNRYLNHGLHYALETDTFEAVKWFIEYGADPNYKSTTNMWRPGGHRPLEIAALNDDHAVFEYLLQHGADPRPLWKKLMATERPVIPDMYRFLAKRPRVFDKVLLNIFAGEDVLSEELRNETVRVASGFIEQDGKGDMAEGVVNVLESLIQLLGRSPVSNVVIETLMLAAAEFKSLRCLKVLLNRVTKGEHTHDWKDRFTDYAPLHAIYQQLLDNLLPLNVASANDDILMLLLERGEMCSECTDTDCIQLPLSHGVKTYLDPFTDLDPFTNRKQLVREDCLSALKQGGGDVEIVKAYHKAGVNFSDDLSFFNQACIEGYHGVIRYMLSQNPNLKTQCHRIDFYSFEIKSFNETMCLLLDQGCTIICKDSNDKDTNEEMGTFLFNVQVFVFTKTVQESCGQTGYVRVAWKPLLKTLMRSRDLAMVKLLRDNGIKIFTDKTLSETRIEKLLKKNAGDADFIRSAKQIYQEPVSLRNQCRIATRRELFAVKQEDRPLSATIQQLPLPNYLKDFLSFNGQHEFEYISYCT